MKLIDLKLKNIGPFKEAYLEFINESDSTETPPVICITGENGTGKSIILDAIRGMMKGHLSTIKAFQREITAKDDFLIQTHINIDNKKVIYKSNQKHGNRKHFSVTPSNIPSLFADTLSSEYKKNFIFDYWSSELSDDSFKINNITALDPKAYLNNALSGVHKNLDVTKAISFFDYLKDSRSAKESELGQALYAILDKIIDLSIEGGKLSHVSRMTLEPIIKIGNREVSLDKLSSGNLYLIQRFTSLLSQVFSICTLNNIPISDYKKIQGVLLIDEAENHLHPKWQKRFLNNILTLFPRLQIIVATHSPFIVTSVKNAKVYVCESQIDHSIVKDETANFSNLPVEEVLLSPLFDTNSFGTEISGLLKERKQAIQDQDQGAVERIEKELLRLNPQYFDYFNIDNLLKSMKR